MNRLFIAAGGGGDSLMAKILSDDATNGKNFFMTIVWERKIFDPRPGPRSCSDFNSLNKFGEYNYIIDENTKLSYDAKTFIPQLCKEVNENFFLIDLAKGVYGLNLQINELVDKLDITEVLVVDAGGDILAKGTEENLKSPLADSFVLSACKNVNVPVCVLAAGLGLDGELSNIELLDIISKLKASNSIISENELSKDIIKKYLTIFSWFPSEVTGMTCLSAIGYRGFAEIRDRGIRVELSDFSNKVFKINYEVVFKYNYISQKIVQTKSLSDVEKIIIDITGKSEIEYERKKVDRIKKDFIVDYDYREYEKKLFSYSNNAKNQGISYLSLRRIGEILEISYNQLNMFKKDLSINWPDLYKPPVWVC